MLPPVPGFLIPSDEPDFLSVLLAAVGVGGVIFVLSAGALVLFWKSLKNDPGAPAEKGSAAAGVNRSFFIRFGALLAVVLLLSFVIFLVGSR